MNTKEGIRRKAYEGRQEDRKEYEERNMKEGRQEGSKRAERKEVSKEGRKKGKHLHERPSHKHFQLAGLPACHHPLSKARRKGKEGMVGEGGEGDK